MIVPVNPALLSGESSFSRKSRIGRRQMSIVTVAVSAIAAWMNMIAAMNVTTPGRRTSAPVAVGRCGGHVAPSRTGRPARGVVGPRPPTQCCPTPCTSTGHGAWRMTWSEVDPTTARRRPLRPLVPITTTLAGNDSASSQIA